MRTDAPSSPHGPLPRVHFDLTTVQLFIATAELGGVTKAAERLHLAPAAASRRILELESQLGLSLFERRPHGMALTEAGRAMLAHARSITHSVLRMQDDAASYAGGDQGVVRIAAPKSAVIQFLPGDIERCAKRCPGVRIDLQEMNLAVVIVFPVLHEDADHLVALLLQQVRRDRGIDSAAQAHHDALFVHRAGIVPAWATRCPQRGNQAAAARLRKPASSS